MPGAVTGFKAWYVGGQRFAIRIADRPLPELRAALAALPDDGFLVGMVYFEDISTITCHLCRQPESPAALTRRLKLIERPDHYERINRLVATRSTVDQVALLRHDDHGRIYELANQPWNPDLKCAICDETVRDLGIRYRRILQGRDYYYIWHDGTSWAFAETDAAAEVKRYPQAIVLRGMYASDAVYQAVAAEAMDDYGVSEFGVAAQPNTTDT